MKPVKDYEIYSSAAQGWASLFLRNIYPVDHDKDGDGKCRSVSRDAIRRMPSPFSGVCLLLRMLLQSYSALTTFGKADMRSRAAPMGMSVRSVSVVLRSAHFTGSWSVMPVESYPHDGI